MAKLLTEPQAWREIARRIAQNRWGRSGLCREVGRVDGLTSPTRERMRLRIRRHLKGGVWEADLYGHGFHGARYCYGWAAGLGRVRVLAALWLALEAEEELKASRRAARSASQGGQK